MNLSFLGCNVILLSVLASIPSPGFSGNYETDFRKYGLEIDAGDLILEVGSGDLRDAIHFHKCFKTKVYSFDCNPDSLMLMQEHFTRNQLTEDDVEIIPYAVSDEETTCWFYPINENNIGASSLFPLNRDEYTAGHTDAWGAYAKKRIEVTSITLGNWLEQRELADTPIGLIMMDLQGAELKALKGLGPYLQQNVKAFITEGDFVPLYEGGDCIYQLLEYLEPLGFKALNHIDDNGILETPPLYKKGPEGELIPYQATYNHYNHKTGETEKVECRTIDSDAYWPNFVFVNLAYYPHFR